VQGPGVAQGTNSGAMQGRSGRGGGLHGPIWQGPLWKQMWRCVVLLRSFFKTHTGQHAPKHHLVRKPIIHTRTGPDVLRFLIMLGAPGDPDDLRQDI